MPSTHRTPQSQKRTGGRLVRCLGPSEGEHMFYSNNPTLHRICARCQRMQDSVNLSRNMEKPVKVASQNP